MKTLLLSLCLCVPAFAGFTFVGAHNGWSVSATNVTTGTVSVLIGDVVYVIGGYNAGGSGCTVTLSVADVSANNIPAIAAANSISYACGRSFYRIATADNASYSVTLTASANIADLMVVMGVFRPASTASILANAQGNATSGTSLSTAALTTTVANQVVVVGSWNYYGDHTVGSGFTIPANGIAEQDLGQGIALEYQIVATPSSVTPSFGTTNAFGIIEAASFQESGAAPRRRNAIIAD
jgi:hypothetical protein